MLRARYPHEPTAVLAAELGRTERMVYSQAKNLGVRKSEAYLASPAACQFRPGFTPWNKGVKGATGKHPNTAAHHFKPGNRPHTWVPVGTLRVSPDGYLQRKLSDTGYWPRDWVGVHRSVWEAAHGPVPEGRVVVFKAGRRTTDAARITPDALECITRRELMQRNSVHRHGSEIYRAAQLRGAITRQINRRLRAEQQQGAEQQQQQQGSQKRS